MEKVHGISRRIKEAGVDPADCRNNMSEKSWNILFVKKKIYFICKLEKIAKNNNKKSWREHALNVDVNHVIKQEHDLKQR